MSVAAVPALKASHGSIVNVASVAGVRPTGSSIPYAASKAALNHMTVLLAKVVGPEVRVNAVAPGLIDTPWTADWDFVREVVQQAAPLKRSGQPDDVAEVIVALARSAYVTGQVVVVDGGLSIATLIRPIGCHPGADVAECIHALRRHGGRRHRRRRRGPAVPEGLRRHPGGARRARPCPARAWARPGGAGRDRHAAHPHRGRPGRGRHGTATTSSCSWP